MERRTHKNFGPMLANENTGREELRRQRGVIRRLCMIVSGAAPVEEEGLDGMPAITRDEALGLLSGLLSGSSVLEETKRLAQLRGPVVARHFAYTKYTEIFGHNGMIDRLCYDNSSEYAFSGSADGIIKVWNVREGMLVRSLYGHGSSINDLSVSLDGSFLVSADCQGIVCVWCLWTFDMIHCFDMREEVIFCEFFVDRTVMKENESKLDEVGEGMDEDISEGINEEMNQVINEKRNNIHNNIHNDTYNSITSNIHTNDNDIHNDDNTDTLHNCATFACITASGIVKNITFNRETVINIKENTLMQGESIKAICITDGGRFIVCGGWWPFAIIYDTHDLDHIIVLEEFRVYSLCAAKNGLKIALAAENQLCIYAFSPDTSAPHVNFKRHARHRGGWHKCAHPIESGVLVERMCFLRSFILVAACSDGNLRLFEDEQLLATIPNEAGSICMHPSRNVFAVVGQRLTMYEIIQAADRGTEHSCCYDPALPLLTCIKSDMQICINGMCINEIKAQINANSAYDEIESLFAEKARTGGSAVSGRRSFVINKFYEETLPLCVHDCEFSNDGSFFITSDNQGVIKTYSIRSPIDAPAQQFFASDFNAPETPLANNGAANGDTATSADSQVRGASPLIALSRAAAQTATFDGTMDADGNANAGWRRCEYKVTARPEPQSVLIEEYAAKYMERDKLDALRFLRRYEAVEEEESKSSDDATWTSTGDTVSSDEETLSSTYGSSEEVADSECVSSRTHRNLIASDSEDRPRILKRMIVYTDSSEQQTGKRRVTAHTDETTDSEESEATHSDSSAVVLRSSKQRRRIVEDRAGQDGIVLRRMLVDGVESERATRQKETKRKARKKRLRRIIEESSTEDSAEGQRGRVRTLRRSILVTNQSESSSRETTEDSSEITVDSSEDSTVQSEELRTIVPLRVNNRRRLINESEANRNNADISQNPNTAKNQERTKARQANKFKGNEDTGLDPDFEAELARFAIEWLREFAVHEGDRVYFDAAAYHAFVELEGRLGYPNSPESGVYSIEGVRTMHIGSIPYLLIEIGGVSIAFYEYPDGSGIMCLESQYNKKRRATYLSNGEIITANFQPEKGLYVSIDGMPVRRTALVPNEATSLGVDPISYERSHRLLFGEDRKKTSPCLEIINYKIVNQRLVCNLYRAYAHFLKDLHRISKHAPADHSRYAKDIYDHYSGLATRRSQ